MKKSNDFSQKSKKSYCKIFINFDLNYQITNTCDWFGQIDSPQNAIFGCVLALYFCLLVLGHLV